MATPQPYVVQSETTVSWEGESIPVSARTVVDLVPGSALYNAYGGSANLEPLSASQYGSADTADHSTLEN